MIGLAVGPAVLLAFAGCAGSDESDASRPVETATESTVGGFEASAWIAMNQEDFDGAASAMTRFAEAAEAGELVEAQGAASEVRQAMTDLASRLDNETHPEALELRSGFVDCSQAYGAAEDALANADADAFTASAPLFRRCLGIAAVDVP